MEAVLATSTGAGRSLAVGLEVAGTSRTGSRSARATPRLASGLESPRGNCFRKMAPLRMRNRLAATAAYVQRGVHGERDAGSSSRARTRTKQDNGTGWLTMVCNPA